MGRSRRAGVVPLRPVALHCLVAVVDRDGDLVGAAAPSLKEGGLCGKNVDSSRVLTAPQPCQRWPNVWPFPC